MPADNLEVMRRGYEAWNRDDFDAARAILHPDVEYRTSGLFPGLGPVYHGPEGFREFWLQMREPWERFEIDIEREIERNGVVIVEVRFRGVGRGSGVTIELPFVHVAELEDGLVTRFSAHATLDEALQACGLAA